jgi:hypothetical protein
MKRIRLGTLFTYSLAVVSPGIVYAAPANVAYQPLPKPGAKVPLGPAHYFTYGFEKPPKLGNAIMRVDIFTLDGQRDRSFVAKGDLDMPSMRGAHSTGSRPFVISAKGVYLMPLQLVMPGDWEFRLTLEKQGETVFRGAYAFDI